MSLYPNQGTELFHPVVRRPPHFYGFYLLELYQVLTENIGKKNSSCFWQGKRNHFEIHHTLCSSSQGPPSKETILPEPGLLWFY